jgi:hypothetical protein
MVRSQAVPERVQLSRAKGWRMPENTVKVDRTTPWGNPFVVGKDGNAARCVELFRFLLGGYVCMSASVHPKTLMAYYEHARDHRHELRGKNLACWCRKGAPCHADVLLELANQ